ncbi:MAG: hypothetical protein GEU75_04410 [Dehalococcoidia bacterium]|nr:hypothetical protein [Dehalococcoidia bacterium]
MAVYIPDIEVYAYPGGGAAQTHLYTADIFTWFKLKVAYVIQLNSAHKFIVLLLLLSHRA